MLFKHFAILATLAASALAMPLGDASGLEAAEERSLEVRGAHKSSGLDLDLDLDIALGNSMKPTCYGEWVKHPKHHKKVWKPSEYTRMRLDRIDVTQSSAIEFLSFYPTLPFTILQRHTAPFPSTCRSTRSPPTASSGVAAVPRSVSLTCRRRSYYLPRL